MAISFGGLASGLDTTSMISQLVAAERASAAPLASRQSDLNTHRSIVSSLSSALSTLATSARALGTTSGVSPRTASASSPHANVAASDAAPASSHALRVQQLARGQVVASRALPSNAPGVVGAGSVEITHAGVTATASWTATDSLDTIASKINEAAPGASASVMFDGAAYRLVVSSRATGLTGALAFADHGDGLGLGDPANVRTPARDAIVELDGISITRSTNVIDDALAGVTITATAVHAASDPDTAIEIAPDRDALRDRVKAFVGAYNTVNGALQIQLGYTGSPKGTNTLFGDSTLRQLQGALATASSSSFGGKTLADVGITRDKSGGLVLDETKLAGAVTTTTNAVEAMFASGGFAAAVTRLTDEYTRGGDGILAMKTRALNDRHKVLQSQIDNIYRRAEGLQANLERQFNALETVLSRLQSQSAYLAKIL